MHGLRADVARLPLGVLRARLRRDRHGLRVLVICVVLLGAACFFYWFAELVMAALIPVLHLAFGSAVARAAAAAFLAQGKPKLGGADGAFCEDHLVLIRPNWAAGAGLDVKIDEISSVLQDASRLARRAAAFF